MSDDPCAMIEQVLALAREAAQRIIAVYSTDFGVAQKEDRTPLTAADMAAHETIVEGLKRLTPDIPILSEESAEVPFAERASWRRYWLVDPLDGTREFIKRNGEFTVNIALIDDHAPVMGVICAPVSGQCYYACRGQGAYKMETGQAAQPIHTRKRQPGPMVVAGSRSHNGESLRPFLEKLGIFEFISMGSSLKSCLVAEGRADVYPRLGPTSEWDTAAAQCIVEEAGGHVTDRNLRRLRYNTKESLLNPDFLVFGDEDVDWLRYLED